MKKEVESYLIEMYLRRFNLLTEEEKKEEIKEIDAAERKRKRQKKEKA